jgi:hypothetical protein
VATTVIFLQSARRSGTTFLRDLLQRHPELVVNGEILLPELWDGGWYDYLRKRIITDSTSLFPWRQSELFKEFTANLPGDKVVVDLKTEELELIPALNDSIYGNPDHLFLILMRTNLLKQIVSELLMNHRIELGDRVVHREYVPQKLVLRVHPPEILRLMRVKHAIQQKFRMLAKNSGCRYLEILYEDLQSNLRHNLLDEIQNFLGIARTSLSGTFVKQNPQPIAEIVENFSELAAEIKGSEFAYCLSLPT